MLENALTNKNKSLDYKDMTKELEKNVYALQHKIREKNLPVIVLLEGWGASGKGSLISDMIQMLDPRFFKVYSVMPADETERRYPMMKRFWAKTPKRGTMAFMDRSWYQELAIAKMEEGISDEEYSRRINTVNTFERQLSDDGCLIIKLFLHISQKEQKKRFLKLREDSATKWRVTELDKKRHKNYEAYYKQFDDMLMKTNTPHCPWRIIDSTDRNFTRFQVFNILVSQITNAVNTEPAENMLLEETAHHFELSPCPKLSEVKLEGKTVQPSKYYDLLKKSQKEISRLHGKIYKKKIPVVMVFEGWDAAGKGGTIKRVSYALDPRGFEAVPISAPDKNELAHHYLWRFWNSIPKTGHITIFDRSWYGRVMVEKIEGFTSKERCAMAYREINEFEQELTQEGVVILKFWLHIDKDEQLRRFNDRMSNPEKQWKITDEDWRNREKWDQYEAAVDEMIAKTSTAAAPWHIIEANSKLYARLKVMDVIIDVLSKKIKNAEKNDK